MSTAKVSTRREAEGLLIRKAQEDSAFRRELMADPSRTIAKTFNVPVPAGVKISVLEETDRQVYLVLPAGSASGELAEGELARVAGGLQEKAAAASEAAKDSGKFGKILGVADKGNVAQ